MPQRQFYRIDTVAIQKQLNNKNTMQERERQLLTIAAQWTEPKISTNQMIDIAQGILVLSGRDQAVVTRDHARRRISRGVGSKYQYLK